MQKHLKGGICLLLACISLLNALPAARAEGEASLSPEAAAVAPAPAEPESKPSEPSAPETAAPASDPSAPAASGTPAAPDVAAVLPASAAPSAPPAQPVKPLAAPAPAPKIVSTPRLIGYRVSPAGEIQQGGRVELTVQVRNESILTEQIPQSSLLPEVRAFVIARVGGSFSFSGKPQVVVTSQPKEPLTLSLVFPGCTYSGKGNAFRFELGYSDFPTLTPDTVECTIKECKETPVVVPDGKEPQLQISRNDLQSALSAGQDATLRLTVTNLSKTAAVKNPVLTLATSSGLMLAENTSTFPLKDLGAGEKQTIDVKIKALSEIPSQAQSLDASVKFSYEADGKSLEGAASEKIPIPAVVTGGTSADAAIPASDAGVGTGGGSYTPVDSPVPNVIISRYTFGGEPQVPVGSSFTLSLEFFNTSAKMKVENLMMTVDPGEGFALNASSNTFFFDVMKKGAKRTQEIPMLVLPSIKGNTQDITVTFKYEYVDHRKRTTVTLPQKISVPVYQPDRFEVTMPTLPATITVGEEATISLPFFNKGKSDVSNVSATLTGEISALTKLQNLGNYEPGKSGTIDFIVTPEQSGDVPLTVTVSYETASGEAKSKEFPMTLSIAEAAPEMDEAFQEADLQQESEGKNNLLILILVSLGALGGLIALLTLLRAKKKRAVVGDKTSFHWEAEVADDDPLESTAEANDADA